MANKNTQELLLNTAIDLFCKKGYLDTSIRDIGAKAGMSSSLVYHYYKDKEEILFQIVHNASRDLLCALQEVEARIADPQECLKQMLAVHIQLLYHGPRRKKESKIVVEDHYFLHGKRREIIRSQQRQIYDLYLKKLKELAETGVMNDVDATVVNFSLFGIINWFHRWYKEGGRLSKEEVAEHIQRLLFHGIVKAAPAPALEEVPSD